jgi:methylated-DNA-protein-cysteine methyltransferase-like protein
MVVWLLNSSSETRELPWHRVISAPGRIALKGAGFTLQRRLLRAEGVRVSPDGSIELARFGWQPQHKAQPRRPTRQPKEKP